MVETPSTREAARASSTGTVQELIDQGLTAKEAQTRAAGFTGEFGEGRAEAFRQQAGLTFDDTGTLTQQNIPVEDITGQRVLNAQLSEAETFKPKLHTVQADELQKDIEAAPTAPIVGAGDVTAQQIAASTVGDTATVNQNEALAGLASGPEQVAGTFTSPVETLNPATLNVQDDALVEKRLASMFADIESGEVPSWAKAAHNTAQETLAARGIGASSIAAGAISLALMQSALPIAAQDAQTYFQADIATFNAKTQADLVNFQTAQQNMLTDVSIANATAQFNASSKTQTQQFTASLISSIQTQNANMVNSMAQFNAAQENQVAAQNAGNALQAETFNVQQQNQIEQFNAQLESSRNQFNAEMAFAVDQSNVIYRRNVNTQNTAAINAANQVNTQNLFNMGQTAYNNAVLQARDNVAMINQNIQNGMDRSAAITMQANDIAQVNEQIDANNFQNLMSNTARVLSGVWNS